MTARTSKKPAASGRRSRNFAALVDAIQRVHRESAASAGRAVNVSLTLRNWLIGWHIYEYEQRGSDRARYGERLLDRLAKALQGKDITRVDARELRRYRHFYLVYPQIRESLAPELRKLLPSTTIAGEEIREQATPGLDVDGRTLLTRLSFTHLAELIEIDDPLERAFYEIECIRGNWSVRQLKRQIGTLYFERSGLSRDKKKLAVLVRKNTEQNELKLAIRDPYIFEFLGLKPKEAMTETDLEDALLDRLQEFLLELGHGFCFEARQKGILIGEMRGFVDLVFYHRVLKCHVLVELKVDEFKHEHLGQLNTYVSWYCRNMMAAGDNPPIGLLLCTKKDRVLVEYALSAVDNRLFVSKYQVELPDKKELQRFLQAQRRELSGELEGDEE